MTELAFEQMFEDSKLGLKFDESNREYHQDVEYLSRSGLKVFMDRPSRFPVYQKSQLLNQEEGEDLGTLFHMKVLEPQRFLDRCVHIEGPMNKNPFKKHGEEAREAGKIPIGHTMWEQIEEMYKKFQAHEQANAIIAAGKSEVSYRWIDKATGLKLKCRFDSIILDKGIACDLKTTQSVSEHMIKRDVMKMKYHHQSAFYLRAMEDYYNSPQRKFIHIFVETQEPYDVVTYALGDAELISADLAINHALAKFKHCFETNTWPGPAAGIQDLTLPEYALNFDGEA